MPPYPSRVVSKVKQIQSFLNGYPAYPHLLGLALSYGKSPSDASLKGLCIVDKSAGYKVVVSGKTLGKHAKFLRSNGVSFAFNNQEPLKEFISKVVGSELVKD